jgi:hypothetical protein
VLSTGETLKTDIVLCTGEKKEIISASSSSEEAICKFLFDREVPGLLWRM